MSNAQKHKHNYSMMFETVICSEFLSSETFCRFFEISIHQVFKLKLPGINILLKIMEMGVYLWNIIFRRKKTLKETSDVYFHYKLITNK